MQQEPTIAPCLSVIRLEPEESVKIERTGHKFQITRGTFQISFGLPPGPTYDIVEEIRNGGVVLDLLAAQRHVSDAGGTPVDQIGRLWRQGLLVKAVYDREEKIAVLHNSGDSDLLAESPTRSMRVAMTEDTCLRTTGGRVLIESFCSGAYFMVISEKLSQLPIPWIHPLRCSEWAEKIDLPEEVVMGVASCLMNIGAVRDADSVSSQPSTNWSFADRMLHARSRMGRHIGEYGRKPIAPKLHADSTVVSPPMLRTEVDLPRPEMSAIIASDRSFADVLESRRSRRHAAEPPISKARLSEFLYRAARVTGRLGSGADEITLRPYPSGGGLHELEIYPLIHRASDVSPGLYRYDPFAHRLEHVAAPSPETARLLFDAQRGSRMTGEPQVLFLVAARFARVNTKYESVAYCLTLKNLGGLFQTMYLVATAMGLAACALGGGNSDLFCRIAGTDFWQESTVGEFLLAEEATVCPSQNQ
jgi:oxazoline/thiazoline dehydrogenase